MNTPLTLNEEIFVDNNGTVGFVVVHHTARTWDNGKWKVS